MSSRPPDNSSNANGQPQASSTTKRTTASASYVRERGGCQFCKGRTFNRSGLRRSDILSILLLRYPVRCLRCRQRQFTDLLTASLSLPAGNPIFTGATRRENWGSWTKGSDLPKPDAAAQPPASNTSAPR